MPRLRRTWVEDIVDYLGELGGEAHYSDLYHHIEANPRRRLGKEWQAVVRRTIEEHSSDTTVWPKRKLSDLFRSVDGLGAGRWALRKSVDHPCLILKSKVNSPWNDADGESYEFGTTVANWKRVHSGVRAFIERTYNGEKMVIGVATIGSVEPANGSSERFIARYRSYSAFEQPVPYPTEIRATIEQQRNFNSQHSITVIDRSIFEELEKAAGAFERYRTAVSLFRGPNIERGGYEAPRHRPISTTAPKKATKAPLPADPEARRQAIERRIGAHFALVTAIHDRANANDVFCDCTQYADAMGDQCIFEMKSVGERDEPDQVRAAVGQLYHYLFLHRNEPGYENATLCAVFDKPIDVDLRTFLNDRAHIGVVWVGPTGLDGTEIMRKRHPWLFNA